MLHQPEVQFSQRLANIQNGSEKSPDSTLRMKTTKVSIEDGDQAEPTTLMEKWRVFYRDAKKNKRPGGTVFTKLFCRSLFLVNAGALLFCSMYCFLPHTFRGSDPMTVYYLRVGVFYLGVMTLANWLCVLLYDTRVPRTPDRPYLQISSWESAPDQFESQLSDCQNGFVPFGYTPSAQDGPLSWTYCDECQMYIPPRAHHCYFCGGCILKRDHHCYMVGTCIGYRNQRYFVVLVFYMFVVCGLGTYLSVDYIRGNYGDLDTVEMFFPVCFFRMILGIVPIPVFFLVLQANLMAAFCVIGLAYFLGQMLVISQGITIFELRAHLASQTKPSDRKVRCTRPVKENFQSVFGDFWPVNFLFPGQLLFRQTEDGFTWPGLKTVQ